MFNHLTRIRSLAVAVVALASVVIPGAARAAGSTPPFDVQAALARIDAAQGKRSAPSGRIAGGNTIPITSAPWQVALIGYDFSCGGVILNATTVLTAAHCAQNIAAGATPDDHGLGIIAGNANLMAKPATEQLRLVKSLRVHPYYDSVGPVATTGDLAVLTLASPLTLNGKEVKAIGLPPVWTPVLAVPPVPAELRVTGFGINATGGTSDDLLREVAMTAVADPDVCGSKAEAAIELCAVSAGGSSCQGDSGGPLVTAGPNPVLVGIVSNGADCGPNTADRYVSLYAPENRAFIDGNAAPPRAPRWAADPTLTGPSGTLMTGDTLTCTAGAFSDPAAAVKIDFSTDDGTIIQSSPGASATLKIPESAVGSHISCRPYVANAGGTYVGRRWITDSVIALRPSCPLWKDYAFSNVRITVKAPKTARRGKTFYAKVTMRGLPSTPYAIYVTTYGASRKAAKSWSTIWTYENGETSLQGRLPVRVKKGTKVGRRYKFVVYVQQAATTDQLLEDRACAAGSKRFQVKIRR